MGTTAKACAVNLGPILGLKCLKIWERRARLLVGPLLVERLRVGGRAMTRPIQIMMIGVDMATGGQLEAPKALKRGLGARFAMGAKKALTAAIMCPIRLVVEKKTNLAEKEKALESFFRSL